MKVYITHDTSPHSSRQHSKAAMRRSVLSSVLLAAFLAAPNPASAFLAAGGPRGSSSASRTLASTSTSTSTSTPKRRRSAAVSGLRGSTAVEDVTSAPFEMPPLEKRFHVHFGAGRLGLGLIVPALVKSRTSFALVQRPKTTWKAITQQGCGAFVDLTVNRQVVAEDVVVISEECDIMEYLGDGHPDYLLAVVGDTETLVQLISRATSFSCSLGSAMNKVLVPLLSKLPKRTDGSRPVLYACENDHNLVKSVGKSLTGYVDVCACMVDRICTGRQIEQHLINVDAEPKFPGSIVVLDPPSCPEHVPLAGENVVIPRSELEAEYYYSRKVSLVNGMHTVLAFLSLKEKARESSGCKDVELITYETAPAALKLDIYLWMACRLLMILDQFGVEMLMKTHNVESEAELFDILIDYGRTSLDRFSSVKDTTSRVLGGGVGNRWATRLRPVVQFLQEKRFAGTGSVGERFLRHAGVIEDYARSATMGLMKDSMQFCTQEVRAAVSSLVEFYKDGKVEGSASEKLKQDADVRPTTSGGDTASVDQLKAQLAVEKARRKSLELQLQSERVKFQAFIARQAALEEELAAEREKCASLEAAFDIASA